MLGGEVRDGARRARQTGPLSRASQKWGDSSGSGRAEQGLGTPVFSASLFRAVEWDSPSLGPGECGVRFPWSCCVPSPAPAQRPPRLDCSGDGGSLPGCRLERALPLTPRAPRAPRSAWPGVRLAGLLGGLGPWPGGVQAGRWVRTTLSELGQRPPFYPPFLQAGPVLSHPPPWLCLEGPVSSSSTGHSDTAPPRGDASPSPAVATAQL